MSENDDYNNETISNLLTVPLDFILSFSEVGSRGNNKEKKNTRRRLLEYKESKCMVRVRLLAFEMDALMKCTTEILIKRRMCRMYSEKVATIVTTSEETYQELEKMRNNNNNNNDMNNERLYHKQLLRKQPDILLKMRSLIPLLYVHGEHGFEKKILFVESETRRCLMELSKCALDLKQFAEQNFNVAENISDTLDEEGNENDDNYDEEEDDGNTGKKSSNMKDLMMEKILVAQVEEALQSRIEALLKMSGHSSSVSSCISDDDDDEEDESNNDDNSDDVFESARDERTGKFLSMKDLCSKIYETLYDKEGNNNNENEEDDDDLTQQEGATPTTSSVTNAANTLFSIGRKGD